MALSAANIAHHGSSTAGILAYREYDGSVGGDRSGLCALFIATKGTSWTRGYYWNTPKPLKEWPGVYTNGLGRVQMLRLWGNSIEGALPSQLGDLTALVELNLARNSLCGNIPPEIGKLCALKAIKMQANRLDGPVPPELGDLTDLETLNLSSNKLQGSLPPALGRLRALLTLEMQNNQLEGSVPPTFGDLERLEFMNLNGNRIQSVLPPLPGLPHIGTCFDLRKVKDKVEIDGYAVYKWKAYLRAQQQQQQHTQHTQKQQQQQQDAPTLTGHAPAMEQQQSQPLPVAVPVDCSQGNGPIPAVLPAIGGHSSSSVAGDGWSGGTLQFPSPITARDLPRVNHAMHTRGSSTSSGIGGAEGGRTDTTAGSLRRLAAQYPVVHQLASGNSDVLVEMRQIVVGQMDVCPGVQIDRVSVEEYVLREVTVLVQMTEGFKAVTSRNEPIADDWLEELPPPTESSLSAYQTTLTHGLCVALFAAHVIGSSLVTKRGTADLETAGSMTKILALVAPDVVGLKSLAEHLSSGRRFVQAGGTLKMADVAADFAECRALAGRIARVVYDATGEGGVQHEGEGNRNFARTDHGPGSIVPDAGAWHFVESLVRWCQSESAGKSDTSSTKEGHRKAIVDLKKILLAVEQGHIGKAHSIDGKVQALVQALGPSNLTTVPNSELQPPASTVQVAELKAALDASSTEIERLKSEVEDLKHVTRELTMRLDTNNFGMRMVKIAPEGVDSV